MAESEEQGKEQNDKRKKNSGWGIVLFSA